MTELVTGSARAYRRDFNLLDAPGWSRSMGAGMGASVSASTLALTMGTTANSESSLLSEVAFTAPSRIVVSLGISQKIANNEIYVELVADNEDGTLDETRVAAWRIAGVDSTVGTAALTQVQNGAGTGRVNSVVNTTLANHIGTTPLAIFEIELGQGETWFHTNVSDSVGVRSSSLKRQVLSPDPSRKYRLRLRFVNAATAPASNTTVYVGHVSVADYTQISAEITSGRGSASGSQALAVNVTGTATINGNGSEFTPRVVTLDAALSSTNLAAGASYTQAWQDSGTTVTTRPSRHRPTVLHVAGTTPGTLIFQESPDNGTTIREAWRVSIPSDAFLHTFDIPQHMRYYRWVFVNGSTIQTAFALSDQAIRGDGAADIDKNLVFPLTPSAGQALGASATFTGPTLDVGSNHGWDRVRFLAQGDQALSSVYVQASLDGTTFFSVPTTGAATTTAGGSTVLEAPIVARFYRVGATAGATALTAFRATQSLLSL